MNFETVLEKIKTNKLNHDKGNYNCIPFAGFERLEGYLPGVEKASYYLVGAGTSIGKSKFVRYFFIHNVLSYIESTKEDIKVDILDFSLEESEEKVIMSEISRYIFHKYKKIVSVKDLQSIGRLNTVSNEVIKYVEEAKEHINKFLEKVHIVTHITNPTGIFKYCRDFALKIGTYYDKEDKPLTKQEVEDIRKGVGTAFSKVKYYKTYHPNHYVIIIVDNYNLLSGEKGESLKSAIDLFSSKYALRLRDKFGFTVVGVQQLALDAETVQYNVAGKSIEEKLTPSISSFGDSKVVTRDASYVLTLFAPYRYKITNHGGYDITKLKNHYRAMQILKSRDGEAGVQVPLFFLGAVDYFSELPKPTEVNKLNQIHNYINTLK